MLPGSGTHRPEVPGPLVSDLAGQPDAHGAGPGPRAGSGARDPEARQLSAQAPRINRGKQLRTLTRGSLRCRARRQAGWAWDKAKGL